MALYNIYRPQKLSEVVGQDHVTRPIKNAFLAGRRNHAYLFVGVRGTGKTSVARIVSRLFNCLNPDPDGEPCNKCRNCVDILGGTCIDIIEMDAASNRSVDDIEALIERAKFSPMEAEFKIYIIDEVHQLSNQAKDALLKTLEEPPKHAVFILATTEANKVPATVRSRCALFEFRKASDEDTITCLRNIVEGEGYTYEEAALKSIAKEANGSFRDAVSVLDSVIGWDTDGAVTAETVRAVIGLPTTRQIQKAVKVICDGNPSTAIMLVEDAKNSSVSFGKFISELSRMFFELAKKLVLDNQAKVFGLDCNQLICVGEHISSKKGLFKMASDVLAFELCVVGAAACVSQLRGVDPWQQDSSQSKE